MTRTIMEPSVTYHVNRIRAAGRIRLWTVQPMHVWQKLQEDKCLYVNPTCWQPDCLYQTDPQFTHAYEWMREQMHKRLPGYQGHYPWWAFTYKWNLRYCRMEGQPGERYVRIELLVPCDEVLLSSFDGWHYVLNRWFFAKTEKEEQQWEEELARAGIDCYQQLITKSFEDRMITSWERIFEEWSFEDSTIQATF